MTTMPELAEIVEIGPDPKVSACSRLLKMYGPSPVRKHNRFDVLKRSASMYPACSRSLAAPGHDGYPRAQWQVTELTSEIALHKYWRREREPNISR
jgi:hypothetical protein